MVKLNTKNIFNTIAHKHGVTVFSRIAIPHIDLCYVRTKLDKEMTPERHFSTTIKINKRYKTMTIMRVEGNAAINL